MGKEKRLEKLLPNGKAMFIPIDHAMSSFPEKGLGNLSQLLPQLSSANAIIAHKGVISHYNNQNNFIMHLSASTIHGGRNSDNKIVIGSVIEAKKRGAIGVSAQINLGSEFELEMIERMGEISRQAFEHGMPLLGMVYPRGPNLKIDENDTTKGVSHAVRLAFELGCDMVKVPWTGDKDSFSLVCKSAPIPVLIAGGEHKGSFEDLLKLIEDAMDSGAKGVCMGRQVFAAENITERCEKIAQLIHQK
ncbi:MAG TPA: 2-amino-3,7-dideoxy-D-threo-hept-6-ulosonate synthase [Candidatus Poseidoniaceae archaeon]|nr:2-amino-3,7-dideoxy-D-threo-hept-6-ulosonate synthase [Candidatus Poseidoniaceae archaeon]